MAFGQFLACMFWIGGIVIAKGFWSVFFAVIFAPYAWYLVIEYLLKYTGIV